MAIATTVTSTAGGSTASSSNNKSKASSTARTRRELNPRWTCYVALALFSLIGYTAVNFDLQKFDMKCNVNSNITAASQIACRTFSLASFLASFMLVLVDFYNSKYPLGSEEPGNFLDLKNTKNRSEGFVLLFFVVWWTGGVITATQTGGIAFVALNIYYSFWVCFFLSLYTLNAWASYQQKEGVGDNISFRNLTHFSRTLRPWYSHCFFAFIVFASTAQLQVQSLGQPLNYAMVSTICIGAISFLVSAVVILAHYKLACCFGGQDPPVGGFLEVTIAVVLTIMWICEVSIATSYGGFAATPTGYKLEYNGTVIVQPGSNIFFASWFSFISMCFVIRQWNTERAMELTATKQAAIDATLSVSPNELSVVNQGIRYGEDNDI